MRTNKMLGHQITTLRGRNMSKEIEFVKQQILKQFEQQKADAGHALNSRGFIMNEVNTWNPKQQDALNDGIAALESEGLIENKDGTPFLTEKGVDYIYPDIGNTVKDAILSYFTKSNARPDHAFNTKAFMLNHVSNWNPKQKQGLEPAMQSLIEDGFVEERENGYFLTQVGYDNIY